jgi:formylglycine-generating enzyme required for sulfatase activity
LDTTPRKPSGNRKIWWIAGGCGLIAACVFCLVAAVLGWMMFRKPSLAQDESVDPVPTASFNINDLEPMVAIPEGAFEMGMSESEIDVLLKENADWKRDYLIDGLPKHTVSLNAYAIDKTEVTKSMFARFIADTQYKTEAEEEGWGLVFSGEDWEKVDGADWQHPRGSQSTVEYLGNYPVVQVTWRDASAYCYWAGRRLPTEAEWEKAARGTDGRIYPWGNAAPSGTLLNFADTLTPFPWSNKTIDDGWLYAAPAGSYPQGSSQYGALDMAGNVYEWIADWYDPTYYSIAPEDNPTGPETGSKRGKRGGAWGSRALAFRTDYRDGFDPHYKGDDVGFRCVR